MTEVLPDPDDLEHLAERGAIAHTPAETHGYVSGLLVSGLAAERVLMIVLDSGPEQGDDGDLLRREAVEVLTRLIAATRSQLESGDFGFTLLLPGDDAPLSTRLLALTHWVQGFLSGLGMGGVDDERLGAVGRELVADFMQITQAGLDALPTEADEAAFTEIEEYLRVGVLNLNEELRAASAAQRPTLQ